MSATGVLVRKECRAQAALCLAIAGAILAGELPHSEVRELQLVVYILGALGLGAWSVGHEYRYGTMAQLLTQPLARWRVLVVKVGVLAVLLGALAAMTAVVVPPHVRWNGPDHDSFVALLALAPLYGLVVAPWLTLGTRSPLAGTLFSGSLAAALLIAGDRIGAWRFTSDRDVDAFKLRVLYAGSALLFVSAGAAFWRTFHRLDVVDAVRSDIALPTARVTPASVVARRNPWLLLAGKELRLQQLTVVVSLLYCLLYLTLWAWRQSVPVFAVVIATAIHAVVVAALAGAFSCAEERALGTLGWQLLQPISSRAQFVVKIMVTVSVTLLLALGLPALLSSVTGTSVLPSFGPARRIVPELMLLLSGSMYVSSVVSSPIIAFFACIPAFMATSWFLQTVAARIASKVFRLFHRLPDGQLNRALHPADNGIAMLVWGVFMLLLLSFAFDNHRVPDQSPRRAAVQLLGLAGLAVITAAMFAAAGRFL